MVQTSIYTLDLEIKLRQLRDFRDRRDQSIEGVTAQHPPRESTSASNEP